MAVYRAVTRFFGTRRRFVRRLAGLSLVVLGVHAAADHIDDMVFAAVDIVDALIDGLAFGFLEALAGMFSDGAGILRYSEQFAAFIDVQEKERISTILAFVVETAIDVALLDFAWGKRKSVVEEAHIGIVDEFKESVRELREAIWPLDLERLAIVPILILFTTTAVLLAGAAAEQLASSAILTAWPRWRFGIPAAAFIGLLTALLLVWRFLPDLIHGALLRAHERAAGFAAVDDAVLDGETTIKSWQRRVRRATRGGFLFIIVLPVAIFGVAGAGSLLTLVERAGSIP